MTSENAADLQSDALYYHRLPRPGKLEIAATKPMGNQRDLALAYSPGVAFACQAIAADPNEAANLTTRQNLVAVLTNGTAVLGLGAIGPLAGKPVMEGKAVLFKKFAGVDVFDIEVNETNVDKLVDIIVALEPTFGGINLEDIKGPECFEVEEKAKARMSIPVFHDDQHGTAIIVAAAVTNALELAGKHIEDVKIVCSGAGAAALASLNLLVSLGARRESIFVCDIVGVVYQGREELMDRWKAAYAQKTSARKLADVIDGADIFLGLSAAGVLTPEHVKMMATDPLIMALANPNPEIMPELAQAARPDAMICTGRSDYPNQVNNVLCFPYMFRGALDVGASEINEAMKHAAAKAIAALAREAPSEVVARAYGGEAAPFGRASLIPSPFDPRLIMRIAPAVAQAAMTSGVARRPIVDLGAYADSLSRFVFRSGLMMKPLFAKARAAQKRVIYSEGEDERVLRATQVVLEEHLAQPILIGRPEVIRERIRRYGLRMTLGGDFEVIDPESDPRYRDYVATYLKLTGRKGVTPDAARTLVRTNATVIAALALARGDADAMLCGLEGRFPSRIRHIRDIVGLAPGVRGLSAMSLIITSKGAYFPSATASWGSSMCCSAAASPTG
jgi:malate dehydrogenase (oxaloacetate-decarboxylating)(NADP+)